MSDNRPAVVDAIATVKIQKRLGGLRGYLDKPEAIALLVEALQSVAVSVSHADEILSHFDDECPTPREIKDVGFNTRDRFLPPKPPQREQWEKEYGPPQPVWSESFIRAAAKAQNPLERKKQFQGEVNAIHEQALRDAIYMSSPAGQAEIDAIEGRNERSSARAWWAAFLDRSERDYPEQMAAIRAGRQPVFRPRGAKEPNPNVMPITAESFAKIEPQRIERCATCGGSGRLAGDDYCSDCALGRDLRRIKA
jgi:hypothetical protein